MKNILIVVSFIIVSVIIMTGLFSFFSGVAQKSAASKQLILCQDKLNHGGVRYMDEKPSCGNLVIVVRENDHVGMPMWAAHMK